MIHTLRVIKLNGEIKKMLVDTKLEPGCIYIRRGLKGRDIMGRGSCYWWEQGRVPDQWFINECRSRKIPIRQVIMILK